MKTKLVFTTLLLVGPLAPLFQGELPPLFEGFKTLATWLSILLLIGWIGLILVWYFFKGGKEAVKNIFQMIASGTKFGEVFKYFLEVGGGMLIMALVPVLAVLLITLFFSGALYTMLAYVLQIAKNLFPDLPIEIPENPFTTSP